jgi:hypothetical protein
MTRIPALMSPEDVGSDPAKRRAGDASMKSNMSPLESSLVAFYLVQQKMMNASYQVTPQEWRENLQGKLLERWQERRGIKSTATAKEQSLMQLVPTEVSARTEEIKQLAGKRAASMSANDLARLCNSFLDALGIDSWIQLGSATLTMVVEGQAAIASVQQCYFNDQAKGSTDDRLSAAHPGAKIPD